MNIQINNILTDMHCHLQDEKIAPHFLNVIRKAEEKGIGRFVCCGTSESDWQSVLDLHKKYSQIIPAVGIHPWKTQNLSESWENRLRKILFDNPECLVGEIGMDLHFCKDTIIKQQEIFTTQLSIAHEFDRPVCIHNLKAWHILLPILKKYSNVKTLLHSYSGSLEITQDLIEMSNIYLSFSGTILDSPKKTMNDTINLIPENRILLETDSPFLLPKNISENKIYNEPANLIYILEKIAELRNSNPEELKQRIIQNSNEFLSSVG